MRVKSRWEYEKRILCWKVEWKMLKWDSYQAQYRATSCHFIWTERFDDFFIYFFLLCVFSLYLYAMWKMSKRKFSFVSFLFFVSRKRSNNKNVEIHEISYDFRFRVFTSNSKSISRLFFVRFTSNRKCENGAFFISLVNSQLSNHKKIQKLMTTF